MTFFICFFDRVRITFCSLCSKNAPNPHLMRAAAFFGLLSVDTHSRPFHAPYNSQPRPDGYVVISLEPEASQPASQAFLPSRRLKKPFPELSLSPKKEERKKERKERVGFEEDVRRSVTFGKISSSSSLLLGLKLA